MGNSEHVSLAILISVHSSLQTIPMSAMESVVENLHAASVLWADTVLGIASRGFSNVVDTVAGAQWSPYDSLMMEVASE